MPRIPLPIKLLLVACILTDVTLLGLNDHNYFEDSHLGLLTLALLLSQINLLSIWWIMFHGKMLKRLLVVGLLLGAYVAGILLAEGLDDAGNWAVIFVVQAVATAVPLMILRQFGFRLSVDRSAGSYDVSTWPHFSLKDLLLLTAGAALLTTGAMQMHRWFGAFTYQVVVFCASLSSASLAALWLACGTRRRGLRLIAFAVVVAAAWNVMYAHPAISEFMLYFCSLLTLYLLVFRLSGYRLARRTPSINGTSNAGSSQPSQGTQSLPAAEVTDDLS